MPTARRETSAALLVGFSVILGLWLRVKGAGGELWLDEIWTLDLIAPAGSAADIFLNTPHANNHYLNSLWLWLVGRDASVLVMRSGAVLMGALSILAAAAAVAKQGKTALSVSAALFATSYFFIHYGSEARGYSGMIFCVLVAKAAMDRLIETRPPVVAWWIFGAAVSIGGFFHVTMVASALALALTAALQMFDENRLRRGLQIAGVSVLACVPFVAVFAANMLTPGFQIGNVDSFTFGALFKGLAGMARATIGFSDSLGDVSCILAASALAILGLTILPRSRRFFPIVAIFVIPAIYVVARAPTQAYPRFHILTAIGLLLLMSEVVAILLAGGRTQKALACIALVFFAFFQTQALANFYRFSRGSYREAVRFMAANGHATYAAEWIGETTRVVRHATKTTGDGLIFAPIEALCETPPEWLIRSTFVDNPAPLENHTALSAPSGACAKRFVLARSFPAWGLSGVNWWIYRRTD